MFKAHRKFIHDRKAANVTSLLKKKQHKCSVFKMDDMFFVLPKMVLESLFKTFYSALILSKK